MNRMRRGRSGLARRWLAALAAALVSAVAFPVAPQPAGGLAGGLALTAAIDGAIGPATTRFVSAAIDTAAERGAEVLILRLDTPGGLVSSTREIIQAILASPVPVVGYVAPSGAHAASAGTYILLATHVAAMAPGTSIGAATPVSLGGPAPFAPEPPAAPERRAPEGGAPEDGATSDPLQPPTLAPEDAMNAKITNDAVAFIRSLAELRGRNADWAERAVRRAATATNREALALGAIEIVAQDANDLLRQLDGRAVSVAGRERVLATRGLRLEALEPDWLTEALRVIADPNIALPLMLIGVYGLIFEVVSPGAVAPGVIGAIALILGLYALNQLPLNHAGLALIALGVGLMATEAVTPSFGVLGLGGIAAFVLGGAFLMDTDAPEFRLSWSVLAVSAALSAGLMALTVALALRAHRRPPASGTAALLGREAEVLDWSGREGFVWAEGERWRAVGDSAFAPGGRVRIIAMEGLTLRVAAP